MADEDDRFTDLFAGRKGSVLGDMRESVTPDAAPEPDPAPPPETKLTETKMAWAREGRQPGGRQPKGRRLDGGGRLPPGQSLTRDWPVLDLGYKPLVPADQLNIWRQEL